MGQAQEGFLQQREVLRRISSLDDLEFYQEIGSGGFSTVYIAQQIKSKYFVAVKILEKQRFYDDQKSIELINSELNILQQLDHPNIVSLICGFQNQNYLFLIFNLATCGDLLANLHVRVKYPEIQVTFIVAQIVLALDYLHQKEIIMRDLKLENIVMNANGYIQITDFGLSKQQEQAGTFCGTLSYIAPEVIQKQSYTKMVDYWQLGVVAYSLISGFNPFDDKDDSRVVHNIINNQVIFNNLFSKNAQDFIGKCLSKDPNKRMGNKRSEVFNHPWFSQINFEWLYQQKYNLENMVVDKLAIRLDKLKPQKRKFRFDTRNSLNMNIGSLDQFNYQIDTNLGEMIIMSQQKKKYDKMMRQAELYMNKDNETSIRKSISYNDLEVQLVEELESDKIVIQQPPVQPTRLKRQRRKNKKMGTSLSHDDIDL